MLTEEEIREAHRKGVGAYKKVKSEEDPNALKKFVRSQTEKCPGQTKRDRRKPYIAEATKERPNRPPPSEISGKKR
ncbi:MAG: hypothetical protein R2747_14075 [Pyrinomonadaceae bacterium]